jgi:hypothetical protein
MTGFICCGNMKQTNADRENVRLIVPEPLGRDQCQVNDIQESEEWPTSHARAELKVMREEHCI